MKISFRMLFDMEDVLYDKEWFEKQKGKNNNFPVYEMRREVKVCKILRYDITIIFGRMLGKEFNKTFGHYHPRGYPEIYEVLRGEAIYILQKPAKIGSRKILDVILVRAKKGEKVIIPPGYGHVTVNPSRKKLVMANIVSSKFTSIYEPYKKLRGACVYITKNGIIHNPNYELVSKPKILRAKKVFRETLEELMKKIEKIEWLEKPKKFPEKFWYK